MPATATDRLAGITTSVAVKPPCVAVTSYNIALSGLQTIGSVAVQEGDRVLVCQQTNAVENGIYNASTSDWPRALDFDGARDVVTGTLVVVRNGVADGVMFEVITLGDIQIGTTAITFGLRDDPVVTYAQNLAEIAAAVVPANHSYAPVDVRRYGALFDNSTNDTLALNKAILVAQQSVAGAVGNVVQLPLGAAILASEITLPNDVRLCGTNKNGSILLASAAWNSGTYPYMLHPTNGASSMFDSLLENLTVDCNNRSGLGAIISDGWQNNCGPRRCLIYRFTTYGILYSQAGYAISGGADILPHEDIEIFGSDTITPTAGIKVEQISSVGNCVLHINRGVIAGGAGHYLPRGIDIVNDSSILEKVHFEQCTTGVYLDGVGSHVLINCSGADTLTNLVEVASTFTGTLLMIGCRRGSATNFLKDNRSGGYGTLNIDLPFFAIGRSGQGITADNTVKAWCVFDGTTTGTHAPTKGFNVTSVTRNSAGDYTITFTNVLRSASACLSVMTAIDSTDGWWVANKGFGLGTANFTIRRGGGSAGAKVDSNPIEVVVFGLGI